MSHVSETPRIMAAEAVMPTSQRLSITESWSSVWHKTLVYGLGGVLAYGVITFGVVEPWSLFGFQALAAGLFLFWIIGAATTKAEFVFHPLFIPAILFAAIVGLQLAIHRSAYAFVTRTSALTYVAYAIVLFVALQTLRKEGDLKRFVGFITAFGFMVAIFAVIQELTSKNEIYWMVAVRSASFIYGPYVNHNHYAGLMEMLAPFPLVLSIMEDLTPPKRVLLAFAGVCMGGTIFLSLSRGGMIAFACELVALAVVLWWKNTSRKAAMFFGAACVLILIFLLWLGGKSLVQRLVSLKTDQATYHTRLQIARDSVAMVKARPILGFGLGTFPTVYPRYRTFYAEVFINEAHNDYVQVVTETGFLGLATVFWFLIIVYRHAIAKLRGPELDLPRAATLGALLGVTGILVHSLFDFNLQIPANAATFYVLAGIAGASFELSRRRRRSRRRSSSSHHFSSHHSGMAEAQ